MLDMQAKEDAGLVAGPTNWQKFTSWKNERNKQYEEEMGNHSLMQYLIQSRGERFTGRS